MYDQYIDFLRSTYLVHKNNGQIWTLVDRAAEKEICRNYTIWTVMDKGGGRQEGFPDNEVHQGITTRYCTNIDHYTTIYSGFGASDPCQYIFST